MELMPITNKTNVLRTGPDGEENNNPSPACVFTSTSPQLKSTDMSSSSWRHKPAEFPQTAYHMIAECIGLKPLYGKIYADAEGRHFVQTKYGFEPAERYNLYLENQRLKWEESVWLEKEASLEAQIKLMASLITAFYSGLAGKAAKEAGEIDRLRGQLAEKKKELAHLQEIINKLKKKVAREEVVSYKAGKVIAQTLAKIKRRKG